MATSLEEKLNRILTEKREKILPQNIKKGIKIFDIEGEIEVIDTSDASAKAINILDGKTAYVNGQKVEGTMPNNDVLYYEPTFEEQVIPKGYTDGGSIGKIISKEITVTPNEKEQIYEGLYSKVTVEGISQGDGNTSNTTLKNTSRATTFAFATWLTNIKELDTTGVTSLYNAFKACKYLETLPEELETSQVTSMASAFYDCRKLKALPQMDTSKCTGMNKAFYNCRLIEECVGFNTSNVTSLQEAFYGCVKLKRVSQLDCSSVTNISSMFYNCSLLEELGGLINLGKTYGYTYSTNNAVGGKLDLSACTLLTHDSLMNVINGLYNLNLSYNVANGGTLYTQQLVLGSINLAKLTSEEIAVATEKRMVG